MVTKLPLLRAVSEYKAPLSYKTPESPFILLAFITLCGSHNLERIVLVTCIPVEAIEQKLFRSGIVKEEES